VEENLLICLKNVGIKQQRQNSKGSNSKKVFMAVAIFDTPVDLQIWKPIDTPPVTQQLRTTRVQFNRLGRNEVNVKDKP